MTAPDRPVPISQAALLLVDVQDSFKATPRWERRNNRSFEANVARLLAAWREAGLPVFFFLHSDADEHFEPTSPHYRLMDFLAPRAGEPLLEKTTRNAFTSTNLQALLTARGVRRLAITGIQMEQCCETTARIAADLGYDVDFVQEATLTFPIQHVVGGRVVDELPVGDIERRTAFALRGRFARIATVDDLVAELAAVAEPAARCA
jgi:nicotinamidase-related amidase